jgi:hypothetical protein
MQVCSFGEIVSRQQEALPGEKSTFSLIIDDNHSEGEAPGVTAGPDMGRATILYEGETSAKVPQPVILREWSDRRIS